MKQNKHIKSTNRFSIYTLHIQSEGNDKIILMVPHTANHQLEQILKIKKWYTCAHNILNQNKDRRINGKRKLCCKKTKEFLIIKAKYMNWFNIYFIFVCLSLDPNFHCPHRIGKCYMYIFFSIYQFKKKITNDTTR